jgi:hypothetical protein
MAPTLKRYQVQISTYRLVIQNQVHHIPCPYRQMQRRHIKTGYQQLFAQTNQFIIGNCLAA